MAALASTLLFLLQFYWPYMAFAAAVGLLTGWLSFERRTGQQR